MFPIDRWRLQVSTVVHARDSETILAVASATRSVQGSISTVQHPEAGMGIFAARNVGKGERVGNY